jgi:hypothetical protein
MTSSLRIAHFIVSLQELHLTSILIHSISKFQDMKRKFLSTALLGIQLLVKGDCYIFYEVFKQQNNMHTF